MNITLTIPRFWPAMGGSEMHSRELVQALATAGHKMQVFCHSTNDLQTIEIGMVNDTSAVWSDGDVQVYRACPDSRTIRWLARANQRFRISRPFFDMAVSAFARRELRAQCQETSVIHTIYNGLTAHSEAAMQTAKALGLPWIWTPLANTDCRDGEGCSSQRFRQMYRSATALIALTEHERNWLIGQGAEPSRTFVCPMAPVVSVPTPQKDFRAHHGLGDAPFVLFLGRLEHAKGIDLLLGSAPQVWQERPDIHFLLMGPIKPEMREQLARLNDSRIRVLDQASQADKNAALAGCHLLCLPSRKESLGVAFLEAWHYRKPIVALDIPVLQELAADEAGIICEENSQHIANAIQRLFADSDLRQKLGDAGREKIMRSFNWRQIAKTHERIYQFAIENPISARISQYKTQPPHCISLEKPSCPQ